MVAEEEEQNAVNVLFVFISHQGFEALGGARRSHHDGAVVAGLEGFLVFLRPDEAEHGFVQELVLLLEDDDKGVN